MSAMRTIRVQRSAAAAACILVTAAVLPLLAKVIHLNLFLSVAVAYLLGTLAGVSVLRDWHLAGMWPAAPVAILAPFYFPAYDMGQIVLLALIAIGMNILTGFAGQISIAHGTFVGVGAYATALLEYHYHWPFLATVVVAVVVSGLLGLVIAIPSARLAGIYQVMTTLALAVAFPILLAYWSDYTGGTQGMTVSRLAEPPVLAKVVPLTGDQYIYFITLVTLLLGLYGARNLLSGHLGRAFRAMRDNPIVAQTMGIHLTSTKLIAFVVSAVWAGLGGSLYAVSLGVLSPSSFGLFFSIQFLVIIVVGGLGSLPGTVVGSALIWELGLKVSKVTVPLLHFDLASQVIYGLILIVILILMPNGVLGMLNRVVRSERVGSIPSWSATLASRLARPRPGPAPTVTTHEPRPAHHGADTSGAGRPNGEGGPVPPEAEVTNPSSPESRPARGS
jgi:branched-chain amino acid transport system permease protein